MIQRFPGNPEKIHPWIFSGRLVAAHVRDGLRESTTERVVRVGATCPKQETLNDSAFPGCGSDHRLCAAQAGRKKP
jgi:hypothetical protein